ncbi:MAG: tyrosine-type recombinase/integrase [Pleurocapsa sp.]
MYSVGIPEFKHCSINTSKVKEEKYYVVQLSRSLGGKRHSFGKVKNENYNLAVKAAVEIDEYCDRCISSSKAVDIKYIAQLAKNVKKPKLELVNTPELKSVWDAYVEFHLALNCWSGSYIETHIATIGNLLKCSDFPSDIDKPSGVFEWLLKGKRSAKTAKARFKLVVAAVDWASKNDRLPRQLGQKWRDCLSSLNGKLKADKKATQIELSENEQETIDPFSVREVEMILTALQTESHSRYRGKHFQYYNYVKFLWLTGCRPSEAIALKWKNVDLMGKTKKVKFCEGEVMASGKLIKKKGTKTVPFRYFNVNDELYELLNNLPRTSEYVFVNGKNEPISQHALNRIWQKLLPKLGIKYRIPYQLRHSMISYHANNGFPIPQLAKLVGNSEKVITEHYLKVDMSLINVPTVHR